MSTNKPREIPKPGYRLALASVAFLILVVLFFINNETPPETSSIESTQSLRIGVLPDQNPETLKQRFEPVLGYLSEKLQLNCELIVPRSYPDLLQLFHDQKVDLAYFGGYSYVKARQRDGAIPLVMRRIDTRFTSLFIVRADNPAQTLENLENGRIAFGSSLSTSGHLMPRHFLRQNSINPESFFSSVQYSGAHDKTAYWVRDGKVDVGAANAKTVHSMLEKGLIKPDEIRILWETPPYANYVWAIRPQFAEDFNTSIRDAFLQLSPNNADHSRILENLNAIGYIPANPDDFLPLANIAQETDAMLTADKLN